MRASPSGAAGSLAAACASLSCAVLLCAAAPVPLAAQAPPVDPSFTVQQLRTPTAPAFVLLGIEPTAIERPSTPRAFAASLLSATDGPTIIPENYALQVTPYWLTARPALSFEEYFEPSPGQAFLQSFSLSFATAARASGTSVGFGARAVPWPGRPGTRLVEVADALGALQARNRTLPEELFETEDSLDAAATRRDAAPAGAERDRLDAEVVRLHERLGALNRQVAAVDDSLRVMADRIRDLDHDRVGFIVQLASGIAADYPDNTFEGGGLSRVGVWTTFGYRLERPRLDLLALLRYQRNRAAGQSLIDAGGRLVHQMGPVAASAELVVRSVAEVTSSPEDGPITVVFESSRRAVGLLEYRATENLVITASFGRDFEVAEIGSPLLATLGLDVLLGQLPALLLPGR